MGDDEILNGRGGHRFGGVLALHPDEGGQSVSGVEAMPGRLVERVEERLVLQTAPVLPRNERGDGCMPGIEKHDAMHLPGDADASHALPQGVGQFAHDGPRFVEQHHGILLSPSFRRRQLRLMHPRNRCLDAPLAIGDDSRDLGGPYVDAEEEVFLHHRWFVLHPQSSGRLRSLTDR